MCDTCSFRQFRAGFHYRRQWRSFREKLLSGAPTVCWVRGGGMCVCNCSTALRFKQFSGDFWINESIFCRKLLRTPELDWSYLNFHSISSFRMKGKVLCNFFNKNIDSLQFGSHSPAFYEWNEQHRATSTHLKLYGTFNVCRRHNMAIMPKIMPPESIVW